MISNEVFDSSAIRVVKEEIVEEEQVIENCDVIETTPQIYVGGHDVFLFDPSEDERVEEVFAGPSTTVVNKVTSRVFRCSLCSRAFATKQRLLHHSIECTPVFDSSCSSNKNVDLQRMLTQNLNYSQPFVCSWCNFAYETRGRLMQHQLKCNNKINGVIRDEKEAQYLKNMSETRNSESKCAIEVEVIEPDLTEEMYEKLREAKGLKKLTRIMNICPFCNKILLVSDFLLQIHKLNCKKRGNKKSGAKRKMKVSAERKVGEICELPASEALKIINQQIKAEGIGFNCSECKQKFKRKGWLMDHFRFTHMKNRTTVRLICDICDRGFLGPGLMQIHLAQYHFIPMVDKFRSCEICGFIAKDPDRRFNYAMQHFCRSYIPNWEIGGAHKKIGKIKNPERWTKDGKRIRVHKTRHLCAKCGAGFQTKMQLTRHLLNEHGEAKNFMQCDICYEIFLTKATLIRHILRIHLNNAKPRIRRSYKEIHGVEYVKCHICSKELRPPFLKYHLKKVHKIVEG